MPESTWTVAEPRKLSFDAPVTALNVRIANGAVNVVGTDEAGARLEVSGIEGPPLIVTQKGSRPSERKMRRYSSTLSSFALRDVTLQVRQRLAQLKVTLIVTLIGSTFGQPQR